MIRNEHCDAGRVGNGEAGKRRCEITQGMKTTQGQDWDQLR